ncbi:FAD/NAD(P)-binding domain-containing protein [Pleurotus eryngii]|uniref:FAD/NAD(P)-binding domain-containing protein n=1 Tax=Pleurotus eryngii TaxID=5323 RepID=A0A9P6A8K4_PLEER|nr:FAD/NAD(P)-binding domain-containing protein [Pleurotus eryngii]
MADPRSGAIGIIGAGAAGLITAYTLLQDGFKDVQLLTRDKTPGGIWAEERVYPGLTINKQVWNYPCCVSGVYGEFRFSPLPMSETGGRLTGEDMRSYMSAFANEFLEGHIRYNTEVLEIKRTDSGDGWFVEIEDTRSQMRQVLRYAKIVLCTGGCSSPLIPNEISPAAAKSSKFNGPVIHSSQFRSQMDDLLSIVKPIDANSPGSAGRIVIVGGGKSSQDIAAYLTNENRKVSVVFERAAAVMGVTSPLPDFIRRSRFLGIMSPHSELRTRLERFLHTTWLGSKIVHYVWNTITSTSFDALKIAKDSPLRNAHSLFWGIRTNDEGVLRPNGFHSLVADGKIDLVAPARVIGYGEDGKSVTLSDGRTLDAAAVILGTGFTSSWKGLFSEQTADELGLRRHAPGDVQTNQWDNYQSLRDPPSFLATSKQQQWASSIYRGLVPYKNINRRDFAINGAIFTTNNGYAFEAFSHWISAYFLGDKMRLPATPKEAFDATERNAEWLRKRFPGMLLWTNESYSSNLAFFTWPQVVDEILEDLELPSLRSGGNWLTWPFRVIDSAEIAALREERDAKRLRGSS